MLLLRLTMMITPLLSRSSLLLPFVTTVPFLSLIISSHVTLPTCEAFSYASKQGQRQRQRQPCWGSDYSCDNGKLFSKHHEGSENKYNHDYSEHNNDYHGDDGPRATIAKTTMPTMTVSKVNGDNNGGGIEETEVRSRRLFLTSLVASTSSALVMFRATDLPPAIAFEISDIDDDDVPLLPSLTISTASTTTASSMTGAVDYQSILRKASSRAMGRGKAGAAASVVQVLSLMWLRTAMNHQYRYGGNLTNSLSVLVDEGGISRLYRGLPFALVQGPLTRFGDTAANAGIVAILESYPKTTDWPLPLKTLCASLFAGLWRIVLTPIDACKTVLQVDGKEGLDRLWGEVTTISSSSGGPAVLYRGALATAAATAVGHFPWFLTYNFLDANLPLASPDASNSSLEFLVRAAACGVAASSVSDCCSNSLRVLKTTRQTLSTSSSVSPVVKEDDVGVVEEVTDGEVGKKRDDLSPSTDAVDASSYASIVKNIVEQDGWSGLFGRGLKTRILVNAVQGAAFSILWKYFQEKL